jgi:hypothetical protein
MRCPARSEWPLNAQIASERDALRVQSDRLAQSNGEFVAAVEELRTEIERVASSYNQSCAEGERLQRQVQSLESELAESRRSSEETRSALRGEIASFEAEIARLRAGESELQAEGQRWQREADALRQSLREQQKLLEEREKLHLAAQRERETAWSLRLENLAIEHESSVSGIRHDFLAQISALQDELRAQQEGVRALRRLNEALEEEKTHVSRKLETADRQSRSEHTVSGAELQRKERRIAELAAELQELQMTNELLKAEFIRFEEQDREESRLDTAERRRLGVLRRLFAEAAALLDGAEESAGDQGPADSTDGDSEECRAELLAYDEIGPEESPHGVRAAFRRESAPPRACDGEARGESAPPAADESQRAGGGRKWPFGKGRKGVDRQSLAELEAQARSELQRLSASGDLGAIFDRKK